MRIAFLGDVMLGRGVNDVVASRPPEWLWGDTLDVLRSADLRVANLECCVSDRGRPWDATPKVFHFRAHPRAVDVLRAARIDVVSLANNHTLDYGYDALRDTLVHLESARIHSVGAGRTLDEARRPAVCGPLALAAWTDNEPGWHATAVRAGTNYLRAGDPELLEQVRTAADRAPVVCVSAHWGPNMVERPSREHREYARRAAEAGVHVWHGHSAHIPQGVELVGGCAVLYDCGDVIDDYAVDPLLRNDLSLLFIVDVEPGVGARRVDAWPLRLTYGRVDLATGEDFAWMRGRFTRLCAEMGAEVRTEDGRLVLEPS